MSYVVSKENAGASRWYLCFEGGVIDVGFV